MNSKDIHIGNLIRTVIKQRGYKMSEVADKLGITRQTFNGWLNRDDIYVKDLFTLSTIVGYDFVKVFCQPTETEQNTKVVLQIEVEKDKTNEVLSYIKDKRLYEILKR